MQLLLIFAGIALTSASRIHYPSTIGNHVYVVKPMDIASQYLEQDSRGFYSYGYRGESAAKAEYTTADGSSKGFYSYIDADGKLQTVKYEAGRRRGFTASATNLPKVPLENLKMPTPVKDTPEVQRAKQEHFEAYREAELRAALEPDTQDADQQEDDQRNDSIAEEMQEALLQNSRELQLNEDYTDGSNDNGINDRVDDNDDDSGDGGRNRNQMTTYTLQRQLNAGNARQYHLGQLQAARTIETVHVPVHSYYTVVSPSTKYSVVSPTVITSVPRIESLKLGHSLPISLSTQFASQRIQTK